jgi:hypothetical protein
MKFMTEPFSLNLRAPMSAVSCRCASTGTADVKVGVTCLTMSGRMSSSTATDHFRRCCGEVPGLASTRNVLVPTDFPSRKISALYSPGGNPAAL